jgi:hypothetical protein
VPILRKEQFTPALEELVPAVSTPAIESLGYGGDACRPYFFREIGHFLTVAGTNRAEVT